MIPGVHGCKISLNPKGKQMAENCCSAAPSIEHSARQASQTRDFISAAPWGKDYARKVHSAVHRSNSKAAHIKMLIKEKVKLKKRNKHPEPSK